MAPVKYSFAKAKDILTDTEKNRFVAWALVHLDQVAKSDWNTVSAELGAASGASVQTMHNNILKKLRDKGAVRGTGDDNDDGGSAPGTPSAATDAAASGGTAAPSTGKKRKTPAKKKKEENGGSGDGDEGSPSKKARKPRAKKADSPQSIKSEGDQESVFNSTEASTEILGGQSLPSASLFDFNGEDMQYPD